MTGIIINVIITLVGITVIFVGVMSFFPHLEKILEDKLKNSLSRKSKDHGPLAQIFYRYNHKDSRAWTDWVLNQEAIVYDEALEKLINHIEMGPSTWGAITPEAITALSRFEDKEHLKIFRSIFQASRKMWKKYIISASCYEAALEGVVHIDEHSAIDMIKQELEKAHEGEAAEEQTICIITALKAFSEDADLKEIFVQIITDPKQSLRARTTAINTLEAREDDSVREIYVQSLKEILDKQEVLNPDDHKIIENLLNFVTKEIDEESFELILKSITNPKITYTALKVLDLILRSSHEKFSTEQLYKLTHTKSDENEAVAGIMSNIFNLNPEEKTLCRYLDLVKQYPFKKAPVNNESQTKPMPIPEGAEELFTNLKDLMRSRANEKQQGTSGGIVITGYAEDEKLYLCRALASEKKMHFIYASFEDVVGSSSTAKSLLDLIASHKPCLVYLDDIDSVFKNLDPGFLKSFKHCFTDPLINLFGTLKIEAEITEDRHCILFSRDDLKDLFPAAIEISHVNEAFRNRFLVNKLALLEEGRGQQSWEAFNILEPTKDMGLFEFRKFLTKYFKVSLVLHGKLIQVKEYEKLDSVDFEGKVEI